MFFGGRIGAIVTRMISNYGFNLYFHEDYIFLYLLAICASSSEKCLFRFFAHLKIGLFDLLLWSCLSSLFILDNNPLSVESFANVSSYSVVSLFAALIVSFAVLVFSSG